MKISGTFIANGGENYITIGSFKNDAETDTLFIGGVLNFSYYVIDDVLVIEDTTNAISEQGNKRGVNFYPNPTKGKFRVEGLKFGVETIEIGRAHV